MRLSWAFLFLAVFLHAGEAPHFRADTDLILVNAAVVDQAEHFVASLHKNDFLLFDQGARQAIATFALEDTPISMAIVFDLSGSMEAALPMARRALREFVLNANPKDEYCVVTVRSRPELSVDFTTRPEEALGRLAFRGAHGYTALLDAVYLAAEHVRSAHNPRHALLVISDGEDNSSRYTQRDLLRSLREMDVTLYSVGVGLPYRARTTDEATAPGGEELLAGLAEDTGGRFFVADSPQDLPGILGKLNIRYQYVLGFWPDPARRDGKYHRVQVKLTGRSRRLRAYSRPGYYAPRNQQTARRGVP